MKTGVAAVLAGLLSCAGVPPRAPPREAESLRLQNLRRAARYPWIDDGACAVRESSSDWKLLVERCFYALDRSRLQFRDLNHQCPVAQVDAVTVEGVVAVCLLAQPELAVGVVIVIGVVIVASAIAAEIAKTEAAKRPKSHGPCQCRCFGPWTPTGDPEEGNPEAGRQPHDAECRSECVHRGFLPSNYTCQ